MMYVLMCMKITPQINVLQTLTHLMSFAQSCKTMCRINRSIKSYVKRVLGGVDEKSMARMTGLFPSQGL